MTRLPRYTVVTNVVSPENSEYIGTCWEFFHDEGDASRCYQRHQAAGNVPTIHPYSQFDYTHLGAAHRA